MTPLSPNYGNQGFSLKVFLKTISSPDRFRRRYLGSKCMFLDQKNATDPMSLKDQRHRVVDAQMKAKTVQNSQQIVHSKKIKENQKPKQRYLGQNKTKRARSTAKTFLSAKSTLGTCQIGKPKFSTFFDQISLSKCFRPPK